MEPPNSEDNRVGWTALHHAIEELRLAKVDGRGEVLTAVSVHISERLLDTQTMANQRPALLTPLLMLVRSNSDAAVREDRVASV